MHTIRNRRAANPPLAKSSKHPLPDLEPRKRKQRKLMNSVNQSVPGLPPSFPASISIPPHRGAVASTVTLIIPQTSSMASPAVIAKGSPHKASAAKPKPRKALPKRRAKPKPKLRQKAHLPGKAAAQPAIPLPVQAEILVINPPLTQTDVVAADPVPAPPELHASAAALTPPLEAQPKAQPSARNNAKPAPLVRSRALAAHRPDGLLDHIAAWLASRGRAIRLAFIGKPRQVPQPKARLKPMAVQKPRRDPRQDELARLRQENHKLQLQLQALLAQQAGTARQQEPAE